MDRTEVVTITNMCMVYDGDKVLVQEKIDDGSRYMVLFYKTNKFEGNIF